MVGYKLSKNDWVTPFFVISRSVREKLLVTVFCEHPVAVARHLKVRSVSFDTKHCTDLVIVTIKRFTVVMIVTIVR